MSEPIRVLVADDHPTLRDGLRAILDTQDDILVVGEAANGLEAVKQAAALRPDVVLMDLEMPRLDGVEALRRVLAERPGTRVLVLTSFATDDKVFPAIKAGALGYLLKDSDPDDLARAIRQVHRGESSLHPAVARKVLRELTRPPERPPTPDPLSAREVEVLRLVARGLGNQEIADALGIGEATVRSHVSSILAKLHLASRTQAALYALREGLAQLE